MDVPSLLWRTIDLGGGRRAVAVEAPADVSGADAAAALGLEPPRALIVLNGGTADLAPALRAELARSLGGVARVAVDDKLTVVTGGTDAGIFALFGEALGDGRPAACVGVAPATLVSAPDGEASPPGPDRVPLEPHHTHFLLVRGDSWGVETDAMLELTSALAGRCRSIVVVAGGGDGTRREVLAHVDAGREVVVLAGSGRLADELAAAVRGDASDAETAAAAAGGLITIVDRGVTPKELAKLLRGRLALKRRRATGALRSTLPRLRWKAGDRYPLVPRPVRDAATACAQDLAILDAELLPDFYEHDEAALEAQNTYRLGQLVVIAGGAAATALGAVQAALGGGVVEIAIVEALVAGALTGAVTYLRGRHAQQDYFASRLKAERLRSEYFVFLGRVAPYDLPEPEARLARLRERIAQVANEDSA